MGNKWRHCNCRLRKSKPYKPLKAKEVKCKDVSDIIEALTIENLLPQLRKQAMSKPKYFKMKPFKPLHSRETCVPMVPSMHTRLKYIGHCPVVPPSTSERIGQAFGKYDFVSSSDDEREGGIIKKKRKQQLSKKKVRYTDLMPTDIRMPTPVHILRHTDSDQSILKVPSPKTSGEVIQARRAHVKPGERLPPIPPKSGFELFRPHSGLVLNADGTYVPETNVIVSPDEKRKKIKRHKKCTMKSCCNKKCRKHQKKLQQKAKIKSGATDGTPRARNAQTRAPEDEDELCGLDEIPEPEHIHLPMNLRRGTLESHSLTVIPCTKERRPDSDHYGILTGCFNMFDAKFGARSRGRQALVMSVMAYCLAFHYHPKQWTMKLIDNLMDAGDRWYLQLLEKVHDHSSVQGICEVLPFGKKQKVVLNGKRMQVLLGEPEIVGYTMSLDPTVYNLCRGLKAFFKDNRAGVMMSRVLKVVIWKDKVCYYVFDPAGRNMQAYSNFANGKAAIMNFKDLNSIAELLLARSILQDQKFVLAPVKVLKIIDDKADEDFESDKELTQAEKAMMGYRILNENCAIVNANMHLGDMCFEDARFRQAIPIAVVAMTYAKISPPNTWFSKTLNKILRLGNKLYVQCVPPKAMTDVTIDNIPNEITIGPYACEIILYRERVKGQLFSPKDCFLNIKTGLKEFFTLGYNSGVIEFNNYALAVWKQKDMYYLFDPYPRTTDGLRTMSGKACCVMGLNPETCAGIVTQNFDYLPPTSQFVIHAFKVLKLKKQHTKAQLICTLSDDELAGKKGKRQVLAESRDQGDGVTVVHDVLHTDSLSALKPTKSKQKQIDEEHMGDIVSLVDSIQEDYLPPIPLRYKNQTENVIPKVVNLDSPTVSVTQIVPPWPKPRDKTNEPPEPDPDPEPTPPPTPPPVMPPEGGVEEEEQVEEEEDEEAKKEAKERKRLEEEEARRKAEELPPPLPPPPPSPQPETEEPLAIVPGSDIEEENEEPALSPVKVDRRVLLTQDAQYRFKLRQIRKKMTTPLMESGPYADPRDKDLAEPSNFKDLLDSSQIIRGLTAVTPAAGDKNVYDILPFGAIMAVVTSYKYAIETWNTNIVEFVVTTAKKLYQNKKEKFQFAPVHIIPKIALGHQAYHAAIDVIGEGPSWQLEQILENKFFSKYDRGMVTTTTYSCAIFKRGSLYYLFDGSTCNAMGLRDSKGQACFLRFRTLHDLASRITYNKDGKTEDQQFILSRIVVRRLLKEPRQKLPEDWDYYTQKPKSDKSKITVAEPAKDKRKEQKRSSVDDEVKVSPAVGYQRVDGVYRIEGTTALTDKKATTDTKPCHFVSLIAMLMATMHPIRTWDQVMIDNCIEKGLEIHQKATNLNQCEKRVIKNVILDGKFINVNIKKVYVVNENAQKRLDQYLRAVLKRLRYVIISYPQCNMVICQKDGYYHLFDPYPPPSEELQCQKEDSGPSKKGDPVATWTLYRSIDLLVKRIRKELSCKISEAPEFYTFELTSVKTAPRHSALNYRLSPLYKPDVNPNAPYLKRSMKVPPPVNEKMYWLNIKLIPWSRMSATNDLGFERKTPKTLWREWDIEFPGDLYSLWGSIHPLDQRFNQNNRGKQYLATCALAVGMTQACELRAWTSRLLDGIVTGGDIYHQKYVEKIGDDINHEIEIEKLDTKFDGMFPYTFEFKFDQYIFGFVYSIHEDKFNLSTALVYFFEKNDLGILVSQVKNLAFGRVGKSYFMFDCQSHGAPIFVPGQGSSYMLKCESLNRLIYCMTITLNIRRHGQQFNLYNVGVKVTEITK